MKNETKGALLTLLGGTCWGLSGSMGQYLFQHEGMESKWLVPIRLGLAGIILLIYCVIKYKKLTIEPFKTKSNAKDMIIYGLCGVSFCQFLYFLTIQLSTAATATILQDLSPVFILIYACITSKRKPFSNELIAIVLALLGVFLLTTHGNINSATVSFEALLAGILCAVCVMVYNCFPKKLLEQFPVTILQGWAFLMGGIFFSIVFQVWNIHYTPSLIGLFGIAFVVVIGNILAFTSYMAGVSLIGPEKAILYGFSEPVTAAIISALVLKSAFTIWDALGFALIFLMLVFISKKKETE